MISIKTMIKFNFEHKSWLLITFLCIISIVLNIFNTYNYIYEINNNNNTNSSFKLIIIDNIEGLQSKLGNTIISEIIEADINIVTYIKNECLANECVYYRF